MKDLMVVEMMSTIRSFCERITYIDEAVVEMDANQGSGNSGLGFNSLLDVLLDNGEDLGARMVVEGGGKFGFTSHA